MTASQAAPQRLQGGQAVLDYRVLRELGSRAAPVYAAHRVVGADMQLSVLQHFRRPHDAVSQLTGILRDARAVSELLPHPNLVRIHGAEPVGDEIVVVSEFVEGEALGELRSLASEQEAVISLQVYLRVVVDALAGLAALHGTKDARRRPIGLTHGLVSPSEIIVGLDGGVRVVGIFHTTPLSIPAEALPNVAYLAPEVLHGDRGVDKRADVYGAGALLWEALAGERPWKGLDALQILAALEAGPVQRPPAPGDAAWAEPLVEVAMRAMSASPRDRYESTEEMLAAITPHAKLAPQTTVAMLVRQLAGEKILKRRGEFAQPSSRPRVMDDAEDPSVTKVAPPTRASGVERREDTVTRAESVATEADAPDDSVTKLPPIPAPLPEYNDSSVTNASPFPRAPSAPDLDDGVTEIAPSLASPELVAGAASPPMLSARAITPAAGVPPRPSVKVPLPEPKAPPRPATSMPRLAAAIEEAEDLVTEVRAPMASEPDPSDDTVTRLSPLVSEPQPRTDREDDGVDTVPRDRSAGAGLPSVDEDEHDDDGGVTAVAVLAPVLPAKNDESVTRDRPPVSRSFHGVQRPPSTPAFPLPSALPGPMRPPRPSAIVAVGPMNREDAFGETMDLPSDGAMLFPPILEPAPVPMPLAPTVPPMAPLSSHGVEEELPPPSYKRLGIALGIAVVAAFALLVLVIVRAANQDVSGTALAEARAKAPHGVTAQDGSESVASRKVVSPATRRWPLPPKKR